MKNKRLMIIVLLIIVVIPCISLLFNNSKKDIKLNNNKIERKQFAIYKQKADKTGYIEHNSTIFPAGYMFNSEKTICVDHKGNKVENIYSFNDGKFTVTSNKTVYCTLYFDITNSLVSAFSSSQLVQEYRGEGWVGEPNSEDRFFTNHIYHWYVPSSNFNGKTAVENSETVRNSWNVVFAGQCWQMIRTTENGGVKLLYNGEAEISIVGGETQYDCSDNRSYYHLGIIESEYNISGTKVYSDNYTVSGGEYSTVFTLVNNDESTPTSKTITASNASEVVGMYTCGNSSTSCSQFEIRKIVSIKTGTTANIYTWTYRDIIGRSNFNDVMTVPSSVGYMYNGDTSIKYTSIGNTENVLSNQSAQTINQNSLQYYYSDSYLTGSNANGNCSNSAEGQSACYALGGTPVTGSSLVGDSNDYSKLIGKYTLLNSNLAAGTTGNTPIYHVYYIIGYSSTSYNTTMYLVNISNNYPLTHYQKTYNLSQTYENGMLQNSVQVKNFVTPTELQDNPNAWEGIWKFVSSTYNNQNYYVCADGTNTCTPWFITTANSNQFSYYNTGIKYNYSNTITYNSTTNKYTIHMSDDADESLRDDNASSIWNFSSSTEKNKTGKAHYVCLDDTTNHYMDPNKTECTWVGYVVMNAINYIPLSGGQYISTDTNSSSGMTKWADEKNLLYKMLYSDNVNNTSSTIKTYIDKWYQVNIYNTEAEKLIDTEEIYCGDRSTGNNYGSWNLNANDIAAGLSFIGLGYKTVKINDNNVSVYNISCPNIIDAYTKDLTSKGNGALTYPIGIMSYSEMINLGYKNVRKSYGASWLLSPSGFYGNSVSMEQMQTDGDFYVISSYPIGIRPAIALTSDAQFKDGGNGSMTNPYVVDES